MLCQTNIDVTFIFFYAIIMLLFTPVSTSLPRDTDDADFVSNNTNSFRGVKNMNEQKNTTKTQIKQAAIRQIEKFGIDKTSMRSIAAEANMTTGAIYYYYKNKQDLFAEIVTDSIHFAHRIFHENKNEKITVDSLFSDVEKEVRIRFKRLQEEKLYLLLLSDAMKCDSEFSQKYTS